MLEYYFIFWQKILCAYTETSVFNSSLRVTSEIGGICGFLSMISVIHIQYFSKLVSEKVSFNSCKLYVIFNRMMKYVTHLLHQASYMNIHFLYQTYQLYFIHS